MLNVCIYTIYWKKKIIVKMEDNDHESNNERQKDTQRIENKIKLHSDW